MAWQEKFGEFPQGWEWHRGCYGNPRTEYQNSSPLQSPQQEGRRVESGCPEHPSYRLHEGHRAQVRCGDTGLKEKQGSLGRCSPLGTKTQARLSD